jgi:phage baseplate assembly protein W
MVEHIILTNNGEKIFDIKFGANLIEFIFEPMNEITKAKIVERVRSSVSRQIPQINISKIDVSSDDKGSLSLGISYSVAVLGIRESNLNLEINKIK